MNFWAKRVDAHERVFQLPEVPHPVCPPDGSRDLPRPSMSALSSVEAAAVSIGLVLVLRA